MIIDHLKVQKVFENLYKGDENAHLLWMSPSEFLRLGNLPHPEDGVDTFDIIRFMKSLTNKEGIPLLDIDFSTGQVMGMEGRHRGIAAKQANIQEFPVVIELTDYHLVKEHIRGNVSLESAMDIVDSAKRYPIPKNFIPFDEEVWLKKE